MVKTLCVALAFLALSGCATSIMQGFVGQPLQAAMVQYGPPSNIFDMDDGRRAFQWKISESGYIPAVSNTYSTANIYAPPGAFATIQGNSTTTTTGGYGFQQTCLYTMFAKMDEASKSWRFVGFAKPSLKCL